MAYSFPSKKISGDPITAGEDPSGRILASDWNALLDHVSTYFSVKNFGAVGDGTTDDTQAVQDAIVAAGRAGVLPSADYGQGEGGIVFFPRGVYRITAPLSWSTDNTWLVGEAYATSTILADIASDPTNTDLVTLGLDGAGRRGGIKNLEFYAASTSKCRDMIVIDGATWWRLENVRCYKAGRHGLRIRGTYNGSAINVHTVYSGACGVYITDSSGGTRQTTTSFVNLYSGYNTSHGVHTYCSHQTTMLAPIIEYNGGNGIRLGDTGGDYMQEMVLFGPYFESNTSWDIHSGTGLSSSYHMLHVYGGFASANGKTVNEGFVYGNRLQGAAYSVRLADYTVGTDPANYLTYSLDSTCKFDIFGQSQNVNNTNQPIYRDIAKWARNTGYTADTSVVQNQGRKYLCKTTGTSATTGNGPTTIGTGVTDGSCTWDYVGNPLNEYRGGIEWTNDDGDRAIYGRTTLQAGGPGASASLQLRRFNSTTTGPSNGRAMVGDFSLNAYAVGASGQGGRPIGWYCSAAGAPGTWVPAGYTPSVSGGMDVNGGVTWTPPIEPICRITTTLTADATVTLSSTGAIRGMTVRIVRTASGAYNVNVKRGDTTQLKAMAANTWADFAYYDAWYLSASGSL